VDKGPEWLPAFVFLEETEGNWENYLNLLYQYFREDFIDSCPSFEGRRLSLKRHPVIKGKEATFWHFISDGKIEADRLPDFRSCERIRWPRSIIGHSDEGVVKVWKNKRRGETRICLWLEKQEYLVILADRGRYILPWTAYLVVQPHQKRKLQKEFEECWRGQQP
jgi:hypothetical protein